MATLESFFARSFVELVSFTKNLQYSLDPLLLSMSIPTFNDCIKSLVPLKDQYMQYKQFIALNIKIIVSDVRVRKFAPCLGKPIPNPNTLVCPTLPTPTDLFTNPPTTQDCMKKCIVSHELKPVCGTDGITYINIESLQCKMKCGSSKNFFKSLLLW